MSSVFAKYRTQNFPYRYEGELHLDSIAGGVPNDPKVLEWHIRSRMSTDDDALLADMVMEIMAERDVGREEAIEIAADRKGVNGFRNDPEHGLWIPGAHLKACMKEAASIAVNTGRLPGDKFWGVGNFRKGLKAWLPEHVFVIEDRLYLGRSEPDNEVQSFIHKNSPKGPISAIQYTQTCVDVDLAFTVEADWEITEDQWAAIWLTAEMQGLGSARPQGFGRFEVTKWDLAEQPAKTNGRVRRQRVPAAA